MIVMVLERVPVSLRGELTRWMLEIKAGVFVGSPSALVRDKLWERACRYARDGGCIMAWNTNNEQGFDVRLAGDCRRMIVDFEGLRLVRIP
ncbi:MAG: type I-E CRISPR-associated endoribonuclease Cas2e [Firmicutes bacterium]|jgi:CRISPR-associated protein Cas2|nr:type I-E CRISPR-associated endoribonuclease Cas2e [Bacillota bacterium]